MPSPYGDKGVELILLICIFLFLTSLCVALRVLSRRIKGVYLAWDDVWIFIALFFIYGNGIANIVGVVYAGVGQHAADLGDYQLAAAKQCLIAAEITWVLCNTSIKLSLLHLFLRIFPTRQVRTHAYILIGIVSMFCLGTLLASLLQCVPIRANWDSSIEAACGNQRASWLGTGITNILTDVMVLALPIRSVWNLNLPRVTKIGLIGIFGVGFLLGTRYLCRCPILISYHFILITILRPNSTTQLIPFLNHSVCIISILRIISLFSITLLDLTYTKVPTDIYSFLEPSLGIICACLPILRPFFDRIVSSSLLRPHNATYRASHPAYKVIHVGAGAKTYVKGRKADEGFLGLRGDAGLFGMVDVGRETTVVAGVKDNLEIDSAPSGINVTREWEVERR
ncbi:hypothetical protein MMC15_008455 [Xylographa vitiligo]|nr:hypothetical protein [Xylographa vitiligo]